MDLPPKKIIAMVQWNFITLCTYVLVIYQLIKGKRVGIKEETQNYICNPQYETCYLILAVYIEIIPGKNYIFSDKALERSTLIWIHAKELKPFWEIPWRRYWKHSTGQGNLGIQSLWPEPQTLLLFSLSHLDCEPTWSHRREPHPLWPS